MFLNSLLNIAIGNPRVPTTLQPFLGHWSSHIPISSQGPQVACSSLIWLCFSSKHQLFNQWVIASVTPFHHCTFQLLFARGHHSQPVYFEESFSWQRKKQISSDWTCCVWQSSTKNMPQLSRASISQQIASDTIRQKRTGQHFQWCLLFTTHATSAPLRKHLIRNPTYLRLTNMLLCV